MKRLSPLDVLFDGAADNKPVDRCRPRLPTPVHAVHRLCFHSSVKERLQEKDVIRFHLTTSHRIYGRQTRVPSVYDEYVPKQWRGWKQLPFADIECFTGVLLPLTRNVFGEERWVSP